MESPQGTRSLAQKPPHNDRDWNQRNCAHDQGSLEPEEQPNPSEHERQSDDAEHDDDKNEHERDRPRWVIERVLLRILPCFIRAGAIRTTTRIVMATFIISRHRPPSFPSYH